MNRLIFAIAVIVQSTLLIANDKSSLYIDISEGSQLSERYTDRLKAYLQRYGCMIDRVNSHPIINSHEHANFIFLPVNKDLSKSYSKILNITVKNNEPLSGSILVRKETGISHINILKNIPIAYVSEASLTGFKLQEALFKAVNIQNDKQNITFAQSNEGAISLLLHKEVIAVGVATPLAKIWEKANGLLIVATSKSIDVGGVWAKKGTDASIIENCKNAFVKLPNSEQKNKKLMKLFPAWIESFHP